MNVPFGKVQSSIFFSTLAEHSWIKISLPFFYSVCLLNFPFRRKVGA